MYAYVLLCATHMATIKKSTAAVPVQPATTTAAIMMPYNASTNKQYMYMYVNKKFIQNCFITKGQNNIIIDTVL